MNPKHHIFLTEVLRHGDAARAYKTAYPDATGESLRASANRLLHNPAIAARINAFHESVRGYIEQDIASFKLQQVSDIRRKRIILKACPSPPSLRIGTRRHQGSEDDVIDVTYI